MNYLQWENVATMILMTILVLSLYWLGAGGHAGWGFLLMLNLNVSRLKEN